MKFVRIGPAGEEIPAVLVEGAVHDLRSVTPDIDGRFLMADPVGVTEAALRSGTLPRLSGGLEGRIGAPIARPGAVICVGLNYAAHAAESGVQPPEHPVVFLKTPNTVVGPYDPVTLPRGSEKTDWEVELGVVIGQYTSYLDSPDEAAARIAGYVVVNDLSERASQLEISGGQWSKGKCSPGFTPTGPWLVTPDEVDPEHLSLGSFVNGLPRQQSTTADMIFPVNDLIYRLSQHLAFEPGDLLLTGTPEGVALSGRFPYLTEGDVVEIAIEGLGHQRQRVRPWQRAS